MEIGFFVIMVFAFIAANTIILFRFKAWMSYSFICLICKEKFKPSLISVFFVSFSAPFVGWQKRVECPKCGDNAYLERIED